MHFCPILYNLPSDLGKDGAISALYTNKVPNAMGEKSSAPETVAKIARQSCAKGRIMIDYRQTVTKKRGKRMKKLGALLAALLLLGLLGGCAEPAKEPEIISSDVTCPQCGTSFRENTTYARMIEKYGYCGFGLCDKDS